jgi:serine/threonine-protein kinase
MAKSLWNRLFGWTGQAGAESRRFGAYHIVRIIHEGEKAFVYQARSQRDDGLYAIKAYKPEYNRTARRIRKRYHLRTEGELGLLVNPEADADAPLVRTVDYGWEFEDPARCYFVVQEYVEGNNLKHMIGCGHPQLRAWRLEIARAAARGLAIIHERGFIHRDICSDNVLVTREGRAKLIDFGFMVPTGIKFKEKSGTPSYMSPEQFQVRPLHPASDIYSFGVVLFEMFTGRLPFVSQYSAQKADQIPRRTADLMDKHVHASVPPPETAASGVPKSMSDIILKCLEKTPERRYASARLLLADMAQVEEASGRPAAVGGGAE